MSNINKFEKVSYEQFKKDYIALYGNEFGEEEIKKMYDQIKLPKRATSGSAGYDFFSPFSMELDGWTEILIPTGIRAQIKEGEVLMCFPRSGLGMKYYTRIANTCGVIDHDYYYANNEGHIMCKIRIENQLQSPLMIGRGKAFMQGVFMMYDTTEGDEASGIRTGGMGSTNV